MVVGCIICTLAMLLLGFTRPFASIFLSNPSLSVSSRPEVAPHSPKIKTTLHRTTS